MARIEIEAELDEKVGRNNWSYYFTGGEISEACVELADYHAGRMEHYKNLWKAGLLKNAPRGIQIDPDLIEIESFNLQNFSTSYQYTPILSQDTQDSRNKYEHHSALYREYVRFGSLLARSTTVGYYLSMDDVKFFRFYESGKPSEG